jgi:signal transduction histidine kinase
MALDHAGKLWIGTQSGITWFDTRTRHYDPLYDVSKSFYDISAYNWVQTDANTFWMCSSNGLYRFDSTRQLVERYATETKPYLNTNEVFDIIKDQDVYWIATDNGLHRLKDKEINVYTVADGLAHNTVASIEIDITGNLWVATFGGLSKFNPDSETFQNFYVEDGLPHNEFNRLGKLKTSEGKLLFGTQNGVVYFDPSEVMKQEPLYPLVLTEFSKFGLDGSWERTPVSDLYQLESVTLPAGNKYFQAEFALLNFINASGNRYTYYMEGLEDTWHPLTTLPIVQYNNLPAGTYDLHVRAQSPSGQWSQNTLDIRVEVLQHFYQTTLFKIAVILLIVGLGYVFLRHRMMQRLYMEKMRNRISSDLHDEVGGVLSGVAMQMDLLESRAPDHLKPFMQRVAESSRSAASSMRDVIWSIDSTKETAQDLLERMKACAIELLDPLDIKYKFEIIGLVPTHALGMYLRQNIYLIFKEALNNIIKHAKATEVNIRLEAERKQLILIITDNGVGIHDIANAKGYGLRNMNKRTNQIRGQLRITQASEGGTRVELVTKI